MCINLKMCCPIRPSLVLFSTKARTWLQTCCKVHLGALNLQNNALLFPHYQARVSAAFIKFMQIHHTSPFRPTITYEPRRDPTPFTSTCASRMAHRFRKTSIIFRHVEFLLAQRRSRWTNSEAGNDAFNAQPHLSSAAWHTKFHGISNIQKWM